MAPFTVPSNVVALRAIAVGGTGGGEPDPRCEELCGGSPAEVTGNLPVSTSEVLLVQVAGNALGTTGGSGGGGNGCWGGGGASWVSAPETLVLVAAGGGGDGCAGSGSSGSNEPETHGGEAGEAGGQALNSGDAGRGGQPGGESSAGNGGAAGTLSGGEAGKKGFGGTGGAGGAGFVELPARGGTGGGGGGGYYGGGGGGGGAAIGSGFTFAGSGGGGGGGSNLVPAGGSSAPNFSTVPEVILSYGVIAFTSAAPPAGTVGKPYSHAYHATGDSAIKYALTGGARPPGLALSSSGALAGIPTAAGSYTYTVTATGTTATQSRQDTVTVAPAPPEPPAPPSPSPKLEFPGAPTPSPNGVSFSIGCRSTAGIACDGQAELSTLEKLLGSRLLALGARRRHHTRRVIDGLTSFTLAAGKTETIFVPLDATGKRLLRRFGRLPATLTITLLNASPPTVIQRTTTIRLKHRRHRHHR
jgi:hypothetical protein